MTITAPSVLLPAAQTGLRRRRAGRATGTALLAACLLAGAALLAPLPASAQSGELRDLANRLNRLESELQTLSREVYRGGGRPSGAGGAPVPAAAGEMELRLQRLEVEVQNLTGKFEETGHQVGQLRERIEKIAADMDFRLSQLEQKAGLGVGGVPTEPAGGAPVAAAPAAGAASDPAPAAVSPTPANSAPPPPDPAAGNLPNGQAQEQYDYAFNLIRQGDYANAEKAFGQFLRLHPNHQLSANAQYWMAETHYVRGQFKEAAIGFAEGYQKFPKSSKAPDSLLKLGMSLGNLNQKQDACTALRQLDADFREAPATIKRRAEQEKNRLGCK